MCVVIHAFELECVCVYLYVRGCVWALLTSRWSLVCVWWEAGNQMDLWEIKNLLFIYTIWLNGICFCLLVCACVHVR